METQQRLRKSGRIQAIEKIENTDELEENQNRSGRVKVKNRYPYLYNRALKKANKTPSSAATTLTSIGQQYKYRTRSSVSAKSKNKVDTNSSEPLDELALVSTRKKRQNGNGRSTRKRKVRQSKICFADPIEQVQEISMDEEDYSMKNVEVDSNETHSAPLEVALLDGNEASNVSSVLSNVSELSGTQNQETTGPKLYLGIQSTRGFEPGGGLRIAVSLDERMLKHGGWNFGSESAHDDQHIGAAAIAGPTGCCACWSRNPKAFQPTPGGEPGGGVWIAASFNESMPKQDGSNLGSESAHDDQNIGAAAIAGPSGCCACWTRKPEAAATSNCDSPISKRTRKR